ncbi:unnamed protein product [Ceratitis capitata]|uniref:(Mediterranean fruit fly) hypothetical protein n=1 Tax=Ceratitis capitata TaxID=7213 RepID=A0A811VF59_CERCA|nr:unnamed protein product [Ceratitis capitata]
MALSLRRMKDLEEQVKTIPELQHELTQLRDEKQRLQQTLQRKEDELQRAREPPRPSASPSPAASLKMALQHSSRHNALALSHWKALCGLHTTRDIAVGSPVQIVRSVGTSPIQQLRSITEALYSQWELEEHTQMAITRYEEERALQQFKKVSHVGIQVQAPRGIDSGAQTTAEPKVLKSSVSTMANPTTREAYVNCRPETRSVATSEDNILDPLCDKCRVVKRTVASSTEDPGFIKVKSVSLKLLDSPEFLRSKTFSLVPVHSAGCQTATTYVHAVGVQCEPEQRNVGVQSDIAYETRQTDTRDLIRLCATQTSTEEYVPPPPVVVEPPKVVVQKPTPPPNPSMRTTASNTDAPRMVDYGIKHITAGTYTPYSSQHRHCA